MKKIMVTLAVGMGMFGVLGGSTITASAAKVHTGIPKVFRNKTYKAKTFHEEGLASHASIKFGTKAMRYTPAFAIDVYTTYKVKYKYLGKHTYYLVGRIYGNAPEGGIPWRYKIKYYNAHKIYAKDLTFANPRYTNFIFRR
ncbi:hypothetical protein FD04_GL001327 [Secundilactobacillus odoratitofui DSM 19909 = JCM 15043]|uniref:DUF4430 domain-containing protein n=1 Tax=Secundilactobacillus odoratitofui DSM 19909 = JCM 15043 TaxID=1423776 RepID=A0A0R1LWG4_9LACO|nr:hypothetical protein [Secundilactobacillus odoratitofui]KRK97313.1 hypothetical protein FD04_GL001327 [Secundilactobacillus odoratitofui DSM 19909 = JCM 15043]